MNQKKVLIVSRRYTRKNKLINWVSEIYLDILLKENVIPVIVPISENTIPNLEYYTQNYDGFLMVEGGDVNPELYGESHDTSTLDEFDELKDRIEFACLQHAVAHKKPILGLCRGMHLINTYFGGTLHVDVHTSNKNKVKHINYDDYDGHRHLITILDNTPLMDMYNQKEISVNTYHHQGIQKLGNGLTPMAEAHDGLIEGIYHKDFPFVMGLQFHPERMYATYLGNKLVFKTFINAL